MAVTSRDSTERICSRGAVPRSEARTNAKEAEVNNAKSGAIDRDFLKTSGDKPTPQGSCESCFFTTTTLLLSPVKKFLNMGPGPGLVTQFFY